MKNALDDDIKSSMVMQLKFYIHADCRYAQKRYYYIPIVSLNWAAHGHRVH